MNVKIVHTAPRAVVLAGNRFQEEPQTFWRCKKSAKWNMWSYLLWWRLVNIIYLYLLYG